MQARQKSELEAPLICAWRQEVVLNFTSIRKKTRRVAMKEQRGRCCKDFVLRQKWDKTRCCIWPEIKKLCKQLDKFIKTCYLPTSRRKNSFKYKKWLWHTKRLPLFFVSPWVLSGNYLKVFTYTSKIFMCLRMALNFPEEILWKSVDYYKLFNPVSHWSRGIGKWDKNMINN